jgi:succinoglycan biosynthesis transport protein ExoP
VDLRRQLTIIRHWAWLIVACVLLAGGTAYIVTSSLPKTYEGRVTMIVGQSLTAVNPDYNQLLASQRLSATYASVATTGPIMQRVISTLGLATSPDELRASVSAQAPANNTLIYISAIDRDPQAAANIANAVAQELIAESPAIQGHQASVQTFVDQQLSDTQAQLQSTQAEVNTLASLAARTPEQDQQLQGLQVRLVQLRTAYAALLQFSSNSAANLLSVVDPAVADSEPAGPHVLLNTALAAMFGLLIAIAIAFSVEYLDETVKSPDEVAEVAGIPTLGAIIRMKGEQVGMTTINFPRAPATEAFRTLRTNLDFANVDEPVRSILVTSAIPNEGKTTIASNLAVVFAQGGKRVLLLDADLRRPGIHRAFDLPNSFGLTNLLRADGLAIDSVANQTSEANLRVITTGPLPPNPAELLASRRMKDLLHRLAQHADILVVDSPPLQVVTDAAILASELDGTLLVIDASHTRKAAVRQAAEALNRVGAHILGATINRLSGRADSGYYYYYGDAYGPAKGDRGEHVPDVAKSR